MSVICFKGVEFDIFWMLFFKPFYDFETECCAKMGICYAGIK